MRVCVWNNLDLSYRLRRPFWLKGSLRTILFYPPSATLFLSCARGAMRQRAHGALRPSPPFGPDMCWVHADRPNGPQHPCTRARSDGTSVRGPKGLLSVPSGRTCWSSSDGVALRGPKGPLKAPHRAQPGCLNSGTCFLTGVSLMPSFLQKQCTHAATTPSEAAPHPHRGGGRS